MYEGKLQTLHAGEASIWCDILFVMEMSFMYQCELVQIQILVDKSTIMRVCVPVPC